MATATYQTLTDEQRTFWEMELLPRAVPPFSHLKWGQMGIWKSTEIPENSGDVINWRLLASFNAVTDPLTEGQTPEGEDISISSVTATVNEYGSYVRYSKKLASFGIDRVAEEASDALGEQAGDTFDQLVRDEIVGGSTVQYASTATQRSDITTAMKFTAAEALEALATLKTNKAPTVEDGKYIALVHPHTEYDLYQDTTFQNVLLYSKERGEKNPYTIGAIGDAFGLRFYCTPNAKVYVNAGASNADVYATMVLGKASFGIGGLAGTLPSAIKDEQYGNQTLKKIRPIRLIQKPFGSAGTADPLDQRASIGWYSTFTTKRLREPFMVRVEHGSALGA